jgi:hypothetical protein
MVGPAIKCRIDTIGSKDSVAVWEFGKILVADWEWSGSVKSTCASLSTSVFDVVRA